MCPVTDLGLAAAAEATIPEVVVSAAAPEIGAGLATGLGVAGAGAGLGAALSGAGGGGGPIGGADAAPPADVAGPGMDARTGFGGAGMGGGPVASADTPGVGDALTQGATALMPGTPGITDLSPDLASSLGIDTAGATPITTVDPSSFLPMGAVPADASTIPSIATDAAGGGTGSSLMSWLSHPKNAITAGMLGLSGIQAFSKPKLPSGADTALGVAGPAVKDAQAVLSAGGMAGPSWVQQKQSIDASIAQQEAQLVAQVQQNIASSGGGGANSGLVQQQIAQVRAQLEVQRQQMYAQAASQNVQAAVAELTGGNNTLTTVAQMQLAQSATSRQQATQLAQLAAMLNQSSVPGGG